MRIVLIIMMIIWGAATKSVAQNDYAVPKRMLSKSELKQLQVVKDSILFQLRYIYNKELKENSPGKYQPQRIALVREYLLLFQFINERLDVIGFTTKNVKDIVGPPDRIFDDDGYQIYEYTSLNRPYLKLKNLKYQLVFKNDELVFVHSKNNP